ncbi:D-alanine--D-alanine ligase [Basilea psittacipulmonis]|uniref:D-alanine--D-alanine ligase n=1 Tax=Basilea psittacipulmonis DSM 24701 TaxID=1072685 RepID=A0A077DFY9_9BURK|nr:D-alanine--D-alanine ligase [Basilea psittacipulmonis]AIL32322.1 D-alanine--D-alanine ligase [Basilea psittacipulmonis DSM 24701]
MGDKVVVLYGGWSAEREVSLMSGKGVYDALHSKGVDVTLFDPSKEPLERLAQFDKAFIMLHGRYGEDGVIQGLLELLRIPYTGCGVMASAIAMDKIMTKKIWLESGLPTAKYMEVNSLSELYHAIETLGLPLMLKAPHEGSTIGLVKITSVDQVATAYEAVSKYDDTLLAEAFISGRELTVAVIGKGKDAKALPIVEIKAPDGNYDYQNKYFSDETQYVCPAHLDEHLTQSIQDLCVKAYNALGCEGWARVDLLLDNDRAYLLEINTAPGMTAHSLVPMSAKSAGIEYADLCVLLLEMASCKVNR